MMKKLFSFLLVLVIMALMPACKQRPEKETRRNIILDVDTSVDDIMTILYFLSCPDVSIKAITIENGVSCIDSGAEIVLRLLNLTGHNEIPVAKGTAQPLAGDNAFPVEWQPPVDKPFGLELPEHTLKTAGVDAAELITKLAGTYRNNITILALGPMTNIARAFISHPRLAENIDQIYVSDGSVDIEGSIYIEYPEVNNRVAGWNLWVDARAAGIVFNSGAPVVLVPLDLTSLHGVDPLVLKSDFYEIYKRHSGGTIGKSMAVLMENWLTSYVSDQQADSTVKAVPIWDVVAGMIFHHPEIGTAWQDSRVKIQEGADEIAGQIVKLDSGSPNVRICFKGNQALLDSLLLVTAGK
jgi:inosine-uridine nucleoside N-ribohydrolase